MGRGGLPACDFGSTTSEERRPLSHYKAEVQVCGSEHTVSRAHSQTLVFLTAFPPPRPQGSQAQSVTPDRTRHGPFTHSFLHSAGIVGPSSVSEVKASPGPSAVAALMTLYHWQPHKLLKAGGMLDPGLKPSGPAPLSKRPRWSQKADSQSSNALLLEREVSANYGISPSLCFPE